VHDQRIQDPETVFQIFEQNRYSTHTCSIYMLHNSAYIVIGSCEYTLFLHSNQ
jgi:hypothetical protein